jgi:hypothetical protein
MHGGAQRNELADLGTAFALVETGMNDVVNGIMSGFTSGLTCRRPGCLFHARRMGGVLAARRPEYRDKRNHEKGDNDESCGGTHNRS